MKPLINISNYEDFINFIKEATTFSYEVSKKGLIIASAYLNVRLLIDLKNLNMINNKLQVFNQDFITVQDDFNYKQCNRYILNINHNDINNEI